MSKDKKKTKAMIAKEMGLTRQQYHNVQTTWPVLYDESGKGFYVSPKTTHEKID